MDASAFWLDLLSNLVATIVGVAIGFIIALRLDRITRTKAEKEKEVEKKRHSIKIIALLGSELEENIESMDHFNEDVASNFYPVRFETWKAFSDGGELQWIDDPELIHHLAQSYSRIVQFEFMFDNYARSYFFPDRILTQERRSLVFRTAIKARDKAIFDAKIALSYLNDRLGLLKASPPGIE